MKAKNCSVGRKVALRSIYSAVGWAPGNTSISLIGLTSFFLLWGVFFLKIPVLVLTGIVLTALGITVALGRHSAHINRVALIVLLNLAYWFVLGITVGGIHPADFLKLGYFGGDGRIFVAYLPLLFFTLIPVSVRHVYGGLRTAIVMGTYAIGLFAIWFCLWYVALDPLGEEAEESELSLHYDENRESE